MATTSGQVTATIRPILATPPPVAWSPSGRFIAIGQQGLFWTSAGEVVLFANEEFSHGLVQGSTGKWSWSPIADCGIGIEDDFDGALQANHIDPGVAANVRLVNRGVESFVFSRDGRRLGLVLKEGRIRSIWIVDLAGNRMHEVRRFQRAMCCINLAGWSIDDRDLLYWAAPGVSVAADGWELRSVSSDGSSARWGATLPSPDALEFCGDRLLAIVGGDRFRQNNRLAMLRRNRPPLLIAPRANHSELTCASSGSLVTVVRNGRLVLLDGNGAFVRFLTQVETANGVFGESLPEWGPPGTGILFERHMHLIRQLWYIPEGGTTRFLAHLLAHRRLLVRHHPGALFDWSATPPDGLPAG